MYKGSCLCGTIKIEISGDIKAVTHCHCKICQKAHGAAFATFAASRDEHFAIVQGESSLKSYESSPGYVRTFCVHCGSNIQWIHDFGYNSGWSSFALSLLDTPFYRNKQK
ncbi:GFA family protein, partial [Photobacterium sanctipauli]